MGDQRVVAWVRGVWRERRQQQVLGHRPQQRERATLGVVDRGLGRDTPVGIRFIQTFDVGHAHREPVHVAQGGMQAGAVMATQSIDHVERLTAGGEPQGGRRNLQRRMR